MKKGLFLALVGAFASAHTEEDYQSFFTNYIHKFNKEYDIDTVFNKFNTFKTNFDKIEAHNEGSHSFSMAINEFADMTADEFKDTYYGIIDSDKRSALRATNAYTAPEGYAPNADGVDWRNKNAVTAVKNQGQCGSCWAFSTTGSTEGIVAIKTGKLTPLSEQQLVDCAGAEGNQGCNGGLMDYGFEYIMQNGGLCSESDYAYTAKKGFWCKKQCTTVPNTKLTGYQDVAKDETSLASAVDNQPVSIAIEADQSSFQFYSGGVMNKACGTKLDHGVLAVGYGTDNSQDYWIVKNSWGATWGEKGYIRLARGIDQCGIMQSASYPELNN